MCRLVLLLLLAASAHSLMLASKKGGQDNGKGICDKKGEFARNWREGMHLNLVQSGENSSLTVSPHNEATVKLMHNLLSVAEPDANFMNAGLAEPGFNLNELPEIEARTPLLQGSMFPTMQKHGQSLYHYAATHFLDEGALKGKDVLEVGMGKGIGAAYLSQAFGPKSVEGVDLSEGHIALAKAIFPSSDRLQFMQGRAGHLEQASNSKDFVFDLDNAYMYRDPKEAISEALRVLKPGGKYIYTSAIPVGRSIAQHAKTFEQAGFRVEHSEDVTPKVMASRDQVVAQMSEFEFTKLCSAVLMKMSVGNPLHLWEAWALPGSQLYSMMEEKEYIYSHIVAVKP